MSADDPKECDLAGCSGLTNDEARALVRESVRETLTALGVDTEKPIEFQDDLRFLRSLRKTHETVSAQALGTLVKVLVTGTVALLILGFIKYIHDRGG